MIDIVGLVLAWVVFMTIYILICLNAHNKRLERLEEKYRPQARKQTIARMLAAGLIEPAKARLMLFNPTCTCEDLTTPAYPEFAAVMFDPSCLFHGDMEDKSLGN